MADDRGFQLVSRKKQRRRGNSKKSKIEELVKDARKDASEDCNIDRIIIQIETYRDEIQASDFFSRLKDLLAPAHYNEEIRDDTCKSSEEESLKDKDKPNPVFLGVDDIICYGVGCIRTCPNAKYQFAFLLLLKMFLMIPNEQCFVYEPLFNEHDEKIVKHFGCSIIGHNEEAKRAVVRPSLFFMPHCSKLLYNNVLWANWGPALKNVVIFGNGFSSYQQRLPSRQLNSEVMYIAKILPHLQEVGVPNTFYLKDIFNDSSIHFFHERVLSKIPKDFWSPRPEPVYDINDPEIVIAKQR